MKSFVIIFRQGPRQLNKTALARRQQEVGAWARTQNAAGHKLDPRILTPDALHPGIEKNRRRLASYRVALHQSQRSH